jgi:hypothetical protein
MATVIRQITIDVDPEIAWDALRDWAAVHRRLVPGFLLDAQVDGADRVVTFFNGSVVRELFVSADEQARRLAWAVADGSLGLTHYGASAQVFGDGVLGRGSCGPPTCFPTTSPPPSASSWSGDSGRSGPLWRSTGESARHR